MPMILGPDPLQALQAPRGKPPSCPYKEEGYLPEAMVNFMALLGWSPGRQGRTLCQGNVMVEHFSLDRVGKAGAIFDKDKLQWMKRRVHPPA